MGAWRTVYIGVTELRGHVGKGRGEGRQEPEGLQNKVRLDELCIL